MAAIGIRYGLPTWSKEIYLIHKHADVTAAASEAVHCAGWSYEEVRDVLNITHPILTIDPLTRLFDCAPWEPWPSDLAAERFFAELTHLQQESRPAFMHHIASFIS